MKTETPEQIRTKASIPGGAQSENDLLIFTGNANLELAQDIGRYLGHSLGRASVGRFADGEVDVQIEENVRGKDCFVIQPTCRPVNENVMELLLMIDALRRASAGKITAVVPYFGYARGDRKTAPRVPISAKLTANLITTAGAGRVITVDLHAGQIQGFFDIPVDHLSPVKVFLDYIASRRLQDVVIVSPDVGGVERARVLAKKLDVPVAFVDKRRPVPNEAQVYNVIGEVKGKTAVILDDIVDTGGTLSKVAHAISDLGASRVVALITHGVFSGRAMTHIEASPLESLVITNSIPITRDAKNCAKIETLSIAALLGEAIIRNHRGESISALFI